MNETRKPNRLAGFDYASCGVYFITVCTAGKCCILSEILPTFDMAEPCEIRLTAIGREVEKAINAIGEHYESVTVDRFVIMPNHIHLLLRIAAPENGRNVSVHSVIGSLKRAVTRSVSRPIWQKGFYDHVIRNPRDHAEHWKYIDANPMRWIEDEYYLP